MEMVKWLIPVAKTKALGTDLATDCEYNLTIEGATFMSTTVVEIDIEYYLKIYPVQWNETCFSISAETY